MSPVLDRVMQLRPVTYQYNREADEATKTIGFVAQEVQPLFPELIAVGENDYLGMSYANVGTIAIKAIQELKAENEALRAELQAIKAYVGMETDDEK